MERLNSQKKKEDKPTLNLHNMLGIKLFKENEDNIELYRIVGIRGSKIKVRNEADGSTSINNVEDFAGFTPLGADGYFTANVVTIADRSKKLERQDVIVTCSRVLEMQVGQTFPYAICRQSITDIFYNLLCADETEQIVGLSVNRDDCPTNFDIGLMLACNSIKYTEHCSFYREDTLEDILSMINTKQFDLCLSALYAGHCKHSENPKAFLKKEDGGWCKDLKTLLAENTFQSDINEMLGITDVMFDMNDYLIETKVPGTDNNYNTVIPELKVWLSGTFRVAMNDIAVLEYEHDINLGDYNNATYFFLRDINNKLWFCVYTVEGKYLESDLEEAYNKLDVSDKYRIKFYDKYNRIDKDAKKVN